MAGTSGAEGNWICLLCNKTGLSRLSSGKGKTPLGKLAKPSPVAAKVWRFDECGVGCIRNIERFSNDCRKNQNQSKLLRPITTGAGSAMNQSQFLAITYNSLEAREKSRVHGAIGFWFWFSLIRTFKPITKLSNHVSTFDSHLKTAQRREGSYFSLLSSRKCSCFAPHAREVYSCYIVLTPQSVSLALAATTTLIWSSKE